MTTANAIRISGFCRVESWEIQLICRCRLVICLLALGNLGLAAWTCNAFQELATMFPTCSELIAEAVTMLVLRVSCMFLMCLVGLFVCNKYLHHLRTTHPQGTAHDQ